MKDNKNTKLLAFFFRSCPIIPEVSDEEKTSVLSLGTNYVYAADFDNNPKSIDTDKQVCKKGLWYVSKRQYGNIGINDFVVDDDHKYGFGAVSSKERPEPFKRYSRKKGFMWPVRVAPSNLTWLNPYQYVRVFMGKPYIRSWVEGQNYDPKLMNLCKEWQESKKLPEEVKELFENP